MAEGINMGRKSHWKKEEYISLYNKVDSYGAKLAAKLMIEEGVDSAAEAKMSYSIYKCPIVYLFIQLTNYTIKQNKIIYKYKLTCLL